MRVVLLNDKRPECEAMVRALQDASFTVEAASDTRSATVAIAREGPQLIIASLPSGNGADLVRLLRGADASGQAYLLAVLEGSPTGRDLPALLAAGIHDFIRRPVVDAELVARAKAPMRLMKWAQSLSKPAVFDFSRAVEVRRLSCWRGMGLAVADDLSQVFGREVRVTDGYPRDFSRGARSATIPMSLTSEQLELRISVVADAPTLVWLGATLLGDQAAGPSALDDVLRELANTAGGAVKRGALAESITLTTGLPVCDEAVRSEGDDVACWTMTVEGTAARIATVGEIRKRENRRLPASTLREGMVLVHDLRSDSGALLATAGSRLTSTTASRLAQMLGPRVLVEVASAA